MEPSHVTDSSPPTTAAAPEPNSLESDPPRAKNLKLTTKTSQRGRRSAIAQLPKATRDEINHWLDDGQTLRSISQLLSSKGITVTEDTVGRWKKGGYQEYLRELRLLEESRQRFELTLDLAKEEQGIDVFQTAHKIAAALICEAVAEIGPNSLRRAVKAKPLNFLRMLNTLSRLTAGGLKCERLLADHRARPVDASQPADPGSKNGLSRGAVKQMEDAIKLM